MAQETLKSVKLNVSWNAGYLSEAAFKGEEMRHYVLGGTDGMRGSEELDTLSAATATGQAVVHANAATNGAG
jgi:hypothetical protein